jgi:ketopantoate reductase
MKLLVCGAGTIGLTYGWLLSYQHEIDVLVKPEKSVETKYSFIVHDLRQKPRQELNFEYQPRAVTEIGDGYDAVLVTVNRYQLKNALPLLRNCDADVIFMQNNWDIQSEIRQYLEPCRYLIGFPSQVGGGREENRIEVNIYSEGTILGEADGQTTERLIKYKEAFEQAGLSVELKPDVLGWLKVHYLQQSISAGAILKAGGYHAFAANYKAVKEMVYAFREGAMVCQACGIDTKRIFPASMFRYPAPLVAAVMKKMFNQSDTAVMVKGHMKQGLKEWVFGYYEVLKSGEDIGIPMPVWKSYKPFVDEYAENHL